MCDQDKALLFSISISKILRVVNDENFPANHIFVTHLQVK